MDSSSVNPWLEIPASDYERHMEQVGQLQLINRVFQYLVASVAAKSVVILGCTTGNGVEHIDFSRITRIVGIDINPDYLELARQRYGTNAEQIEWRCADLNTVNIGDREFDLIYGALIFEYLDVDMVLPKIYQALRPTGRLGVVLQLPTQELPAVSATPYTSLEKLASIMKLLTAEQFRASAMRHRLVEIEGQCITLSSGKTFFVGIYGPEESPK